MLYGSLDICKFITLTEAIFEKEQMPKSPLNIEDIINEYLDEEYKRKRKELDALKPEGKTYYKPSSSGMCSRKIFYETIEKADRTNESSKRGKRIMRLGTIIHEDIQKAFNKFTKEKDNIDI